MVNGDALLLLGPPDVVKTHLAITVGREVIHHGHTVLFTTAWTLLAQLAKAQHESRLEDKLLHFTQPKLLIIDELADPVVATAILDRLLHQDFDELIQRRPAVGPRPAGCT